MGNTKEAYTAGGMFDAMKKTADVGILNSQVLKQLSIHSIQVSLLWIMMCVNNILKKRRCESCILIKTPALTTGVFISSLISEYIFEECFLIHSYLPV